VAYNRWVANRFKYQQIADNVARGIQAGLLRPGERLPSLRSVCRSHGASLMTAVAAYRHLETLGLVKALPRSGYRVKPRPPLAMLQPAIRRPRLSPFRTERAELTAQVLAGMANPALVPLGNGCPSAELYPLPAFRRTTARLLQSERKLWASYSPPRGDLELRRLIAQRYNARGMDVRADDVLVTAGAMEALTLSLRRVLNLATWSRWSVRPSSVSSTPPETPAPGSWSCLPIRRAARIRSGSRSCAGATPFAPSC